MKRHSFPIPSPTLQNDTASTDEGQVVATYDAPCRNRTCNLMIKSQLRASGLPRTAAAQPFHAPSNVVGLVPPVDPKSARHFPPISHGADGLQVPDAARNTRPHMIGHGAARHAFGAKAPPNRCRYSSDPSHRIEVLTKMVAA